MENFCGKANLSKRLRVKQSDSISVDHMALEGVPTLGIDITKPARRKVLEESILWTKFCTCTVHGRVAPKRCKEHTTRTASTEVRLLNFVQQLRVGKLNLLYAWTCKKMILMLSERKGNTWSVENPANSLMWITDPFLRLFEAIPDLIAFSFHTCMFAAERKKDTALWTSWPNCDRTSHASAMANMSISVGAKRQLVLHS